MKSVQIKSIQKKKKYANKKYTNEKKYMNEKRIGMESLLMKNIKPENSIEWKTTFKCLFNKTKWKVHLAK